MPIEIRTVAREKLCKEKKAERVDDADGFVGRALHYGISEHEQHELRYLTPRRGGVASRGDVRDPCVSSISMLCIVYVSSASRLFDERKLLRMLGTFQENNARANITGMLLYKGGNFMQAIEGPKAAVQTLFARIQKDPRHTAVFKLIERPITQREFSNFYMGFQNVDKLPPDGLPGFTSFLDEGLTAEVFRENPGRAHKLLRMFKTNMR